MAVLSFGSGFFSAVAQQSSVYICSAAFVVDWPRWQPLNIAVAMPYWRDAIRRVSWQVAMATVEWFWFLTLMDSKLCDFHIHSFLFHFTYLSCCENLEMCVIFLSVVTPGSILMIVCVFMCNTYIPEAPFSMLIF